MAGLLLIAASGLAREVLAVERLLDRHAAFHVVDDNPALWGTEVGGVPVVGGIDLVGEYADHDLLVCAGRGPARRGIVARLRELGVRADRFATTVHPGVDVPAGSRIGRGSIVLAGAVMTADVSLGEHVVAMPHVTLTHDDVVGDYATLCAGVTLGGEVTVGEGAYLGMSSSVRERVTVGADAVLGMGAVLLRDLPAGETWVGTPARPFGVRLDSEA